MVRGSASVAAVITARIDRLRPSQQLTLKVAKSVGHCLVVAAPCSQNPRLASIASGTLACSAHCESTLFG